MFCDSIHIDDPNRSCPAIIGGKYNTLVFQCYMRIPHSSFIKYSSQNLAAFFLHPAMYEVRNFVDIRVEFSSEFSMLNTLLSTIM